MARDFTTPVARPAIRLYKRALRRPICCRLSRGLHQRDGVCREEKSAILHLDPEEISQTDLSYVVDDVFVILEHGIGHVC